MSLEEGGPFPKSVSQAAGSGDGRFVQFVNGLPGEEVGKVDRAKTALRAMSSADVLLIFEDFLIHKTTRLRRYLRVFADYWAEKNRRDKILKLTLLCTRKMGKEMPDEMVTVVEALTRTGMEYATAVNSVWRMQRDRSSASIEVYFKMITDDRNDCVSLFKADIERIIKYWKNGEMRVDKGQMERLMHICTITEIAVVADSRYGDDVQKIKSKHLSGKNHTKAYVKLMKLVVYFYADDLNSSIKSSIDQEVVKRFYDKYGPIFEHYGHLISSFI